MRLTLIQNAVGYQARLTWATPGSDLSEEPAVQIDGRPIRRTFPIDLDDPDIALGDAEKWLTEQIDRLKPNQRSLARAVIGTVPLGKPQAVEYNAVA